jgi:hypothetical protein
VFGFPAGLQGAGTSSGFCGWECAAAGDDYISVSNKYFSKLSRCRTPLGLSKGSQGAERLYFNLRQVLRVKGCLAGSAAEKALQQGDMILAINGEPVTCYRDVETACIALEGSGRETLSLTLLRQVGCMDFNLTVLLHPSCETVPTFQFWTIVGGFKTNFRIRKLSSRT